MKKAFNSVFSNPQVGPFLQIMVIFGIATGIQNGAFNNYLHEVLQISRMERGIIELPRELPGLLLFLIIAGLHRYAEFSIVRLAVLTSAVGMFTLSGLGAYRFPAILGIIIWSTGEHMLMPLKQSIAVHNARPGKEGLAMGSIASMANIGAAIGYYGTPLLFFLLPKIVPISNTNLFRVAFLIAALVLVWGFLLSLRMGRDERVMKRNRFLFRKKFTKYYFLEVFFGARKQVFLSFAPYVLILRYGAKTELVSFLLGIWSLSNIFLNPLFGRLLDRVQYKVIIIADTVILTFLCLIYGFAHHLFSPPVAFVVVCVVFIIDSMLFAVGMARAMYVKENSINQEEFTSTLSTGISINHLISILIAIAGGLLWERLGMEILFSVAALFGVCSFLFSCLLETPRAKTV
ncbi:MAG: MFS transporter [Verrucomicrobiota bacterium]|jgi:predicted MFS family arabinose efflux permease|nr:MFS transporter [Verrucomicrobiota bacterium]MDI9383936.1 MFS transporter [Verrucomicrobiota bacterium]